MENGRQESAGERFPAHRRHTLSNATAVVAAQRGQSWTSECSSNARGRAIMTPSPSSSTRARAAGRGGPPDPPGPGARARRGPGGAHPRLARPAGAPRSRAVRRLAPSPDRQRLSRYRAEPAPATDRGRAQAHRLPHPARPAGALADRELVDAALRRLDPGHRAVVALHYLLGMPLPEVAASLGIPLGTAKSRLHHALAAMRVGRSPNPTRPRRRSPEGRSHDGRLPVRA